MIRLHPALLGVLISVTSPLSAATFQLSTSFDATFDDTLTGPIIGTGLLTYTAETALADGVYGWDSLVAPSFVAQFGEGENSIVFGASGSGSGLAGSFVEVRGSSFFFSFGQPDGDDSTGVHFVENAEGRVLLFEPIPRSDAPDGYSGVTPQYVVAEGTGMDLDAPIVLGNYGVASAIPEPSTYALMAGAGILGVVIWRRRRC